MPEKNTDSNTHNAANAESGSTLTADADGNDEVSMNGSSRALHLKGSESPAKSRSWRRLDVVVVSVVIVMVWVLLSLPAVFYHLPQVSLSYCSDNSNSKSIDSMYTVQIAAHACINVLAQTEPLSV